MLCVADGVLGYAKPIRLSRHRDLAVVQSEEDILACVMTCHNGDDLFTVTSIKLLYFRILHKQKLAGVSDSLLRILSP